MGHDISAYAKDGEFISGPYFSRFWTPHYEYFDARHHNDGISGDGKDEHVTADQLRRILKKVNQDLFRLEDELQEYLEEYGDYRKLGYGAAVDPKIRSDQDWLMIQTKTLDEFSEFLKACIAGDVGKVRFC